MIEGEFVKYNYQIKKYSGMEIIESPDKDKHFGRLFGTSQTMQRIYHQIEYVAEQDMPVFINGETGTGKELCAQAIHKNGNNSSGSFITVRCNSYNNDFEYDIFSNIPEGKHTVFFDEITDLPIDFQSKLLGFINARNDIRIISSNCNNNDKLTVCNNLRKDLFYRLNSFVITMPPLRECGCDIIDIGHIFLKEFSINNKKHFEDFSEKTEFLLRKYKWPGNVRELKSTINQSVSCFDNEILEPYMLPDRIFTIEIIDPVVSNNRSVIPLCEVEKEAIKHAIKLCNGNISKAARMLDISASTIYRKMSSWEKSSTNKKHFKRPKSK